jgi:flagellar protein FlgJ
MEVTTSYSIQKAPLKNDLSATDARLYDAALELESAFVFEMLKSAGLGQSREGLNGGAGEDQFSSLLLRHQAKGLTDAGGIGLADLLFQALLKQEDTK